MSTKQAWANGGMIFAATIMIVIGIFQIFVGIAAIVQDNFFVVGPNYAYEIDTTTWGWIHLGIGIVVALAGFFLFTGRAWARATAIALAVISATANFFFLPYYPLWALLIIALNVFVIWAIATARTDTGTAVSDTAMAGASGFGGEAGQSRDRWPAENVSQGRHWAPEPAKEGTGAAAGQPETPEHVSAATRAAGEAQGGSMPSGGAPGGYATPGTPQGTPPTPPDPPRRPQP